MSIEPASLQGTTEKENIRAPGKNPPWYKNGVIYELHVRSFQDGDGDGTGDFLGLTSSLDYLRDFGVTAVWLLPFYPSPLKDDGYDIADYCGVHSMYGTIKDFKTFLSEAHRRGLAYAALLAHLERGTPVDGQAQAMVLRSRFWARWVSAIFFKAYLQTAGKEAILPSAESDLHMMTEVLLLRRTIYELGCELAHRPDWVNIPLQGILELMSELDTTSSVTKEESSKASN